MNVSADLSPLDVLDLRHDGECEVQVVLSDAILTDEALRRLSAGGSVEVDVRLALRAVRGGDRARTQPAVR